MKGEANRTQAQLTDFSPSYLTHALPLSTCIVAIILSNFVLYRRARNKTPPCFFFFLKIAFWENFFFSQVGVVQLFLRSHQSKFLGSKLKWRRVVATRPRNKKCCCWSPACLSSASSQFLTIRETFPAFNKFRRKISAKNFWRKKTNTAERFLTLVALLSRAHWYTTARIKPDEVIS